MVEMDENPNGKPHDREYTVAVADVRYPLNRRQDYLIPLPLGSPAVFSESRKTENM